MTTVITTPFPGAALPSIPALDLEVAFTSDPDDAPSYRSIATGIVRSLHTSRGRGETSDRFATGTFDAELDNRNQRLNPGNTNSPWNGLVLPNTRMRAQLRYAGITYDLFGGHAKGFPQFYGAGLDVTVAFSAQDTLSRLARNDLKSISPYGLFTAGLVPDTWYRFDDTARLTDSSVNARHGTWSGTVNAVTSLISGDPGAAIAFDGTLSGRGTHGIDLSSADDTYAVWFSVPSTFTEGTIVDIRANNIVILIYLTGGKLRVWNSGSSFYSETPNTVNDGNRHRLVFTGSATMYLDGVQITPASGGPITPPQLGPGVDNGALRLGNAGTGIDPFNGTLDEFALWSGVQLSGATVAADYVMGTTPWTGDTTGQRAVRILDAIGVAQADRAIETGKSVVAALTSALSGDALSYFSQLAGTEMSQGYADASGRLTLRSRHSTLTDTRSKVSQVTFDNQSATYPYLALTLPFDDSKTRNPVTVQRSGGNAQTVNDPVAEKANGSSAWTHPTTMLYASDIDSYAAANWWLSHFKNPDLRVESIVICPQMAPATLWPAVLGREIGDRITIVTRWPNSVVMTKDYIVEGIDHDYDRMGDQPWTVTLRLSPAETLRYWILGDATYGVLGQARLAA